MGNRSSRSTRTCRKLVLHHDEAFPTNNYNPEAKPPPEHESFREQHHCEGSDDGARQVPLPRDERNLGPVRSEHLYMICFHSLAD